LVQIQYAHIIGFSKGNKMLLVVFDLVDQMQWEDLTDFLTLEEAGLENQDFDTVPAVNKTAYFFEEQ
jgi:hypothetical protein